LLGCSVCRAQQVAAGGGSYSLNLSTQSISVKTCGVLAKLLATSNPFVDIKFNDCSLPDEGMPSDYFRVEIYIFL